jgi:hypothetical protein
MFRRCLMSICRGILELHLRLFCVLSLCKFKGGRTSMYTHWNLALPSRVSQKHKLSAVFRNASGCPLNIEAVVR